jgi:uncharacterized protein (DUF1501 family)
MKRRDFLQAGLALSLFPGINLYAAESKPKFLLVFLRGGYDAANVLVPRSSGFYYEARPSIALPRESLLEIDADWGLHPALKDVHALYRKGEAAFVPFAGTEDLSRSHFETQDSIESGGNGDFRSGFMNRLASELKDEKAISFTDQLPLVFRGEAKVANAALRFAGRSGVDARQSDLIAQMYKGTPLAANVNEGFAVRDEMMRDAGAEMVAASRNAVTARAFETQARRVARLMKAGYSLGFIDVGGWDTHVGEGGASGQLATRLEALGGGLAALAEELGPAWRETTVALISEFGRTFRENGNRGTDHGHGTVYWLLGGALRGGVRGRQVSLSEKTLFQDRDYPVLNEYRALLGGVFARLYGLSSARLERVFPGVSPENLQLL